MMPYFYPPGSGAATSAATQAEEEAASSTTVMATPGRQHYHPGHGKAWVYFDGTGTPAIIGSYNVTSITDNGTGDYTINFTASFSSANYSGAGTCRITAGLGHTCYMKTASPKATGSANIRTGYGNYVAADPDIVDWIFYGDQ